MAFHSTNENRSTSEKQRLHLSAHAWNVLESDSLVYTSRSLAAFINRIIRNYRYEADASVSQRLREKEAELRALFTQTKIPLDEKQQQAFLRAALAKVRKELIAKNTAYPKEISRMIRIDAENFAHFTDEDEGCHEELYYNNRLSLYIKAILEEYARCQPIERERIFCLPMIEEIRRAIAEHRHIKLYPDNRRAIDMIPYRLETDKYFTHYYIIGMRADDRKILTLRVSRLKEVRILRDDTPLTAAECARIDETIRQATIQFIASKTQTIRIRLSPKGKAQFASISHLRPEVTGIEDEDIYIFDCSELQIEYYFLKFGGEAEVLEPASLREKFRLHHQRACEVYN